MRRVLPCDAGAGHKYGAERGAKRNVGRRCNFRSAFGFSGGYNGEKKITLLRFFLFENPSNKNID
ncbi:MAG: hypothetical protein DBX55_04395 [Verrucomicrobia bacterium]|nr:MAG: hypothetical protein DBX55_04395 [Verrucomicrobiota bacterium]